MRRIALGFGFIVVLFAIASGSGTVITAPVVIPNNAVTDAKLRDSNGLSVIGRSANSSGDPADIVAASDNTVLRRSGTAIGFGPIPESTVTDLTTDLAAKTSTSRAINTTAPLTGGGDLSADRTFAISTNGIDNTLFRQSGALSVVGRSANSTGNVADISTSADGDVLRRASGVLGFGSIVEASVTNLTSDLAGKASTATTISAGTGLSGGGDLSANRTLTVNISGASCSAGQFVSAISATGGGTCSTPSGGGDPGAYTAPGEGTCNFDGVATPVCGATLTGSTYDMARDVAATTATVSSGKIVKTHNYKISVHGTLTVNGTVHINGGDASGGTAGLKQDVSNTVGAGTTGGSAGCCTGTNASDLIPWGIFPQSTTNFGGAGGGSPTAGSTGTAGRGGGGGGCNAGLGGSAGTNSGTMNSGGTYMADAHALFAGRFPDGTRFTGGTGGGPGGQETTGTATAGGGGAGAGVLVVIADTLAGTGTISANGGNGGNGGNLSAQACAGGGGGGGGGILAIKFRTYSGSLTVSANGGTHGTGAASAGRTARDGGDGGAGVVVCDNTSGDGTKPTGCP